MLVNVKNITKNKIIKPGINTEDVWLNNCSSQCSI